MHELDVIGVRIELPTNQPLVLLRERDSDLYLPIWVAGPEASAIAFAHQGVSAQRPLTHDLLVQMIDTFAPELERIHIISLQDNVFYAELQFAGGQVVDARPSDAIAVAIRKSVPISCSDQVLREGSITIPRDEDDDEVEKFREFLDQVSPDDFGGATPNSDDAPNPDITT